MRRLCLSVFAILMLCSMSRTRCLAGCHHGGPFYTGFDAPRVAPAFYHPIPRYMPMPIVYAPIPTYVQPRIVVVHAPPIIQAPSVVVDVARDHVATRLVQPCSAPLSTAPNVPTQTFAASVTNDPAVVVDSGPHDFSNRLSQNDSPPIEPSIAYTQPDVTPYANPIPSDSFGVAINEPVINEQVVGEQVLSQGDLNSEIFNEPVLHQFPSNQDVVDENLGRDDVANDSNNGQATIIDSTEARSTTDAILPRSTVESIPAPAPSQDTERE